MSVRLISYSQGINDELKDMEELVCYCARVSNPSNQLNKKTNKKLIKYLTENEHWSPLEMVSICLEIETTRDIARQILRHRSFSFQEFSQRYAVADIGYEVREARLQDKKDRQNSIEIEKENELNKEWEKMQNEVMEKSKDIYEKALEKGIAKEQARCVLPEGMIKSRIYMNGTLRSWVHYIKLRSGNGTQKEHKLVALECLKVISVKFPYIIELINNETV